MFPDDPDIELARLYRETLARIREKMSREQCGEAFRGLTVTAEVRSLSEPARLAVLGTNRSYNHGEESKQGGQGRNRRGDPA